MRAGSIAVIFTLLLSLSCGYVGPVLPPSPQLPNRIGNLTAVERGDQIVIAFSTPPRTTDNLAIKRFSEIELRIGPIVTPFDFGRWSASAHQYLLPLPPRNDPDAPKAFPISHSIPAAEWEGRRVAIAVRTAVKEGRVSSWSNVVRLNIVPPLGEPTAVAKATADGIRLTWPDEGRGVHYRVLRQGPSDKAPVQLGTSARPEYLDKTSQFDIPYRYTVVAFVGSAESLPSKPFPITAVDVFPPKVPTGVTALAAPNSIEVSWQRSPDPDLKGYYVYRSVNGGAFERQGDLLTCRHIAIKRLSTGKSTRMRSVRSIKKITRAPDPHRLKWRTRADGLQRFTSRVSYHRQFCPWKGELPAELVNQIQLALVFAIFDFGKRNLKPNGQ